MNRRVQQTASGGGTAPRSLHGRNTISPSHIKPVDVARELQRNITGPATTAKGRAIQQDLNDLADTYYANTSSRPLPRNRTAPSGSVDSRYTKSRVFCTSEAVPRSWREGPTDKNGRSFDASGSNLLCMDVYLPGHGTTAGRPSARGSSHNPLCIVGSADHGLKVFDTVTLKEKKSLYTKTCGHTEWVTACKFLSNGQVLSGGMDSKLCLWDTVLSGPVRCRDLLAHTGSISQVDINEHGIAVSGSYDRTLRIWDCSGYGMELGCLSGHNAPVMQFAWSGDEVLSGDRKGTAKIWDLNTTTSKASFSTNRGQITALGQMMNSHGGLLTMFGDQGGVLTVRDVRQGTAPVFQKDLHPGGALTAIKSVDETNYIVTCGADKRIVVLDPRKNFEAVWNWSDHRDFIYSMETFGPLVLSGGGNGLLLVHDTITGECCYGLDANTAAVREIFPSPNLLITAGDDGKATVYNYI